MLTHWSYVFLALTHWHDCKPLIRSTDVGSSLSLSPSSLHWAVSHTQHLIAVGTDEVCPGKLGPVSIRKTVFPGMGIPMLKIRRPVGRLIFNMGIAIPSKTVFLIETAPRVLGNLPCCAWSTSRLKWLWLRKVEFVVSNCTAKSALYIMKWYVKEINLCDFVSSFCFAVWCCALVEIIWIFLSCIKQLVKHI